MFKMKHFVANPLYIFSFTSKRKPLDLRGWGLEMFEYEVWGVGYFIHFQIRHTTQFFNNYPISSNCLPGSSIGRHTKYKCMHQWNQNKDETNVPSNSMEGHAFGFWLRTSSVLDGMPSTIMNICVWKVLVYGCEGGYNNILFSGNEARESF